MCALKLTFSLRTSGPQNRWRGPEMFVTDVASEIE